MKKIIKLLALALLCGLPLSVRADDDPMNPGIDFPKFEKALTSTGVDGWIHGRIGKLAVFVYREPGAFFKYGIFPMLARDEEVRKTLDSLQRHDKIHIVGRVVENDAPQKHLFVTSLQVLQRWEGGDASIPPYVYEGKVPEELKDKDSFVGKVHYAVQDGSFLVAEYKDVVIPVVGVPGRANNLYRGDKVRIHFKFQEIPSRPSHLVLNPDVAEPVQVIMRLKDLNGRKNCVEGTMVRFPKSPEINFDVYALQNTDADYYTLDYTLINFEDMDLFAAIRAKAAAIWGKHTEFVVNGRNKLHNPRIYVKACGTLNVSVPSQANPQVLVGNIDDLTVEFR